MKILIFGWGDNAYIKRYIENVCVPNNMEVTLYSDKIKNVDFLNYYNERGVKIIIDEPSDSIFYKIPKIGSVFVLMKGFLKLTQNGPYDVCHMHSVNRFRCVLARLMFISKSYRKLVLSFWGSDLLTASVKQLEKMESSLEAATTITLSTEEMRKVFLDYFGNKYDDKIVKTSFPTTVINHISNYLKIDSLDEIKETFGFPKDKTIVVCGYNGSTRQQHIQQFNQFKMLEKSLKNSLYIVVPMTYGGTPEYIDLVEKSIEESGIQGKVLIRYLSELEIAQLWTATDIFIHTQPTDGFSSSMRESLYAGNVVINGSWLNYKELDEADTFILKLDKFEQLQVFLPEVSNNIRYYKTESLRNNKIISNMFSIEKEYKKWSNLYIK